MKVKDLIQRLLKEPQDLEVCIWDDAADEYEPVADVLFEDGSTEVHLLTVEVPQIDPLCPTGECTGQCDPEQHGA
jgi:hypothetical protein